jgi:hypothetical protein
VLLSLRHYLRRPVEPMLVLGFGEISVVRTQQTYRSGKIAAAIGLEYVRFATRGIASPLIREIWTFEAGLRLRCRSHAKIKRPTGPEAKHTLV